MDQQPQPPALHGIQPGPVPVQTTVGRAETAEGGKVVLQVITPAGVAHYFLDPAHARLLASHLQDWASKAESQLQVARVIPDLNGHPNLNGHP